MLFFHKQRLVLLSNTKTGSSSLERVLGRRASVATRFPASLKHMTYGRFMKYMAPTIEAATGLGRDDLEIVVMMREPIGWLRSWYRYRQRDTVGGGNSTAGLSFEQFVQDYLKPEPPAHADVGNQMSMMRRRDAVGVDRVFPYEAFDAFVDWMSDRLGKKIDIPKVNVSASAAPTDLADDTLAALRAHLENPIAFHALLSADGTIRPEHHEIMAREFARRQTD